MNIIIVCAIYTYIYVGIAISTLYLLAMYKRDNCFIYTRTNNICVYKCDGIMFAGWILCSVIGMMYCVQPANPAVYWKKYVINWSWNIICVCIMRRWLTSGQLLLCALCLIIYFYCTKVDQSFNKMVLSSP